MKMVSVTVLMAMITLTAFAQNRGTGEIGSVGTDKIQLCKDQSKIALTDEVKKEFAQTNVGALVGSIRLKAGEETFFLQEEVWNSSKSDVEIYVYRLNTAGLSHKAAIKMSVPDCKTISMSEHGQVE